jgi:hypothetical protein
VYAKILKKIQIGGIFCDLEKDFDCANHKICLAKLHFYGIKGVSEDCFRLYLTNKRKKVEDKIA